MACPQVDAEDAGEEALYAIPVTTIDGKTTTLTEHRGKVMMIVNVASKCGFTKQYAGLQTLYAQYADKGLVVVGFPANDFLRQEPGDDVEIRRFCSLNYGVTFPMYSKITVKGKNQHPLYRHLTGKDTNPTFGGKITWNFNKFLISPDGAVIARFGARTKPLAKEVLSAIEAALPSASTPPQE
ncbi:MAG: glutathione peroxidase [Lentisphaerae bacterium]|nr:glutathione peroxidase [Lentisphaerota bacterium]MBT4817470.1 glutathione peroxidase [Lentisphaerota bacterium]MBT5612747.1 glutathione peroxidase [Lentisphaerota bacterium]MBT7058976.1 glutathione peroxidase [Lentisphaerota bacterium]MBT7848396.1 glutathione peroxidase [Lentisphaerota bacterium]